MRLPSGAVELLEARRADAGGVSLARRLADHGSRMALSTEVGSLTYRELDSLVRAAGDRLGSVRRLVLVAAKNEVEPIVWYLAGLAGGHPVLLADGDDPRHVATLVEHYDPDVVVTPADGSWEVEERRAGSAHDLHPDLALLLSTSGSTGSAKLVRLSADNVQANAESIVAALGVRPTDLAATTLPPHYSYGLSVVNSHLLVGAGLLLTDGSVVDRCFWERFRAEAVTTFAGVPHTFELLDRSGFATTPVPSLRYVTLAGGRLAPEDVARWASHGRRNGWDLVAMYGQTEATARMAVLPPELVLEHPGAIGVPVPGGSFELAPVAGAEDGTGELVYRGRNVMLGYAEAPSDLARGATTGALRTGDLARRTPAGLYEVVGRRSRFVKIFGLRIDLDEVESVLRAARVPSICTGDDESLVIAVPSGSEPGTAREVVARHLALPERRILTFALPELPRLSNGKPDRVAVEAHGAALGGAAGIPGAPRADVRAAFADTDVRAVFADTLGRADIDDTDTFVSLGGDSLSYVEASIRLEGVLGCLPAGWHTTPLGELERGRAPRPRGRTTQVEANVVLRAVAIVTVVGTHAGLFDRRGGAHVLLAVAGFNVARFLLVPRTATSPVRPMLRSVGRIAVPAMCWIGALVALTDDYSLPTVLLVNDHLGSPVFDERWRYWFVEAIVQVMLLLTLAFAVPGVRRADRRWPFGLPFALALLALPLRFEVLPLLEVRHHTVQPQTTLWLFLLGWAAARASSTKQRLLVSAVTVLATPGFFFDDPRREALVAAGVLLLTWVPTVAVPRPLHRVVGPLAAASLPIYLTHWHVFPGVASRTSPAVAVAASLVVGIAIQSVVGQLSNRRLSNGRTLRSLSSRFRPTDERVPEARPVSDGGPGRPRVRVQSAQPHPSPTVRDTAARTPSSS